MEYITLRNGEMLPSVGLGTWQLTDRQVISSILKEAFDAGYRLVDTAAAYSNEIAIAKAIENNGLKREDIILSDKVWNTSRGYDAVRTACQKSLKKLKTDYFDLYLIHWPASMKLYPEWEEINAETWHGMESLYRDGFVKNIGVCNFKIHHLEALKKTAHIIPFVDQVELHPGMPQSDLIDYCKSEGIAVEASSPLGNGKILENGVLKSIAESKGVTTAQISLRWIFQKGIISIPKSSNSSRLRSNIALFDFSLNDDEMELINSIPYCGGIGIDPDEVTQFG